MAKVKRITLYFLSVLGHLLAGGVILYFLKPVLLWYFNYRPILGVDFYNLTTYVAFLARHFVLPFNGWKYIWYTGGPLANDYPWLHAYLALPLLRYFSLPQAVQAYILGSTFLFFFFSYLLFAEIGKDRILAVILAIASAFSIGFYGALVWGGGLQYFATQFFLPLTLYFLFKYFHTDDKRWYYTSTLFLGISFLGHPQVGLSYSLPITFLLLLAFPKLKERYFSWERVKRIFVYFLIAILIGYPQLNNYLGREPLNIIMVAPTRLIDTLQGTIGAKRFVNIDPNVPKEAAPVKPEVVQWNRSQLTRFFSDTNKLFSVFLPLSIAIFVISFLVRKGKRNSLGTLVYALPALWVAGYITSLAFGIGFFQGGWYRAFWAFPLTLGILISYIWGDFWASVRERLGSVGQKAVFSLLIPLVSGSLIIVPGFTLLSQYSAQKMITEMEAPGYRQQSSAFPDSVSVYIGKEELEKLKSKLVPSWFPPNETNYRLYDADQRVNIWWNALYEMPLVKGYVDFPPGDYSGSFYWASIAISRTGGTSDSLVESWKVPPDMAYNNTLFLIDWLSIKYIEAEHERSDSYNPLTSYLAESEIFKNKEKVVVPGWAQLYSVPGGQPIIWHPETEEYLTYYEVADEFVSPIAHSTSAPTIGVIGTYDAYNTIFRDLAALNLNSKKVIPVDLRAFIDDVSPASLKDMEAVILYKYDYKNHGKVWKKLEQYVKEGGKVFIETGSDVKQTNSVNPRGGHPRELPSIFPIKMTKQEELGRQWQLSGRSKETEGVNLGLFGPPILDNEPWLFSLPSSDQDLKEGARVILSANGIPLIIAWRYGEGEVIWSGMNLPFHITTHNNLEEAKLFKNLIENFISTTPVSYPDFEFKRESANKVTIKGRGTQGVIFREQLNPGWQANLDSTKVRKQLPIYMAGPTNFRFSYVKIPKEAQGSFRVTFSYRGEFWVYFWFTLSFLTILTLLDRILLDSRLIVPLLRRISTPVGAKISKWWEREEEV